MQEYTFLDLFCGAGGFSKGFQDAGYHCLAGIDNNADALKTFLLNHEGALALNIDLSRDDAMQIINEAIDGKKVDVVIGSPPCQGFSVAGSRKLDDPRNALYMSMVRAVAFFTPQAFVLENVQGMATLYDGKVIDEVVKAFKAQGYSMNYTVLCAADYGTPQIRRRLFIAGTKQGVFRFPTPTHYDASDDALKPLSLLPETKKPWVTCGDAISDLPSLIDSIGTEVAEYDKEPTTDYQRMMRGLL